MNEQKDGSYLEMAISSPTAKEARYKYFEIINKIIDFKQQNKTVCYHSANLSNTFRKRRICKFKAKI